MTRKSRKTQQEIDVMAPIVDMMIFGSADDPCFGKLNDPTNDVCKRCGDAELCAIVQGQRLHAKRDKQGTFLDDKETNFDLVQMEKFIVHKLAMHKKLSLNRVTSLVIKHFNKFEKVDEKYITQKVYDFVVRSPKFIRVKKDGIKYLKLK